MGEPIKLPDGRTAYGRAQAAVMRGEGGGIAGEGIGPKPAESAEQAQAKPAAASFQGVPGIGPQIEKALHDAGFRTWEDVVRVDVAEIDRRISGIGLNRAKLLRAYAHAMVETQ